MTVTREDLSGLELALELVAKIGPDIVWQALAELRDQAQSAEPVQGEAVEVVCITQGGCNVTWTATKELTPAGTALMSVRQHNRIMAPAKPDAELLELLRQCLEAMRTPYSDTRLMARIDAKLAEANKP